jgi:hypothetical protein
VPFPLALTPLSAPFFVSDAVLSSFSAQTLLPRFLFISTAFPTVSGSPALHFSSAFILRLAASLPTHSPFPSVSPLPFSYLLQALVLPIVFL